MKARILALSSLVLVLGLSSCSSEEDGTEIDDSDKSVCVYSYNEGSTDFEWTSYKTNAKKPVTGTFNEISITSEDSEDPMEVIKSMKFSMNTASVETNDEARNVKVAEHFFGTLSTSEITGKVTGINEESGKATIMITMHGISFDVEGDYTMEDGTFTYASSIDVSSWNGMAGIEALNAVCADLHTGEDGISKLWSEVGLSFSTTLKSDCD